MYEFNSEENAIFGRAAFWTKALAGTALLQAVVNFSKPGHVAAQVAGFVLVLVLVGVLFKASRALSRVVDTEGNDVAHTLEALESWTILFTVRLALIGFVMVSAVASVVLK